MSQIHFPADPGALRQLADRTVMIKPNFLPLVDEARMRAFTVARFSEASIIQEVLDALRANETAGGTAWTFRETFPDLVKRFLEVSDQGHLNTVLRTNTAQAQAVGAYQARQEVKRAFPYVQYQAGINPRPAHEALDGKIFAVDDPFLLAHTPPWDFNCNCDLISRTAKQVDAIRAADADLPIDKQRVLPGNAGLTAAIHENRYAQNSHRVDLSTPTQRGGEYSFRPDRLNQPVNLAKFDGQVRTTLEEQLRSVGYRIEGDRAVPPTPSSPTASKAGLRAPLAPASVRGHVGPIVSRLGVPSVHKARVGVSAPRVAAFAGRAA